MDLLPLNQGWISWQQVFEVRIEKKKKKKAQAIRHLGFLSN